jgi:hypothetical protein
MKEKLISLMVGLLFVLIGTGLFAADGDLKVNSNVVIGTTRDPVTRLEVVTTDSTSGMSYQGMVRLLSSAPQIDFVDSDNNDWAIHVNSNRMYFIRQPWNASDLVLDGAGRIGIGTAVPEQIMHVYTSGADNHILSDVPTGNTYDPLFTMRIQGETVWNMGIDASDSNKFKIANGGSWNNLSAGARLTIDNTTGKVGIGTTSPPSKLAVPGLYDGSGDNFYWLAYDNTTGKIWRVGSSASKYKGNIEPYSDNFMDILKLEPKSFTWNTDSRLDFGYIADEVDAVGLRNLIMYDEEGKPDGIKLARLPVYIIEVLKNQQASLKSLQEALTAQQKEIETLKADLATIKK